MVPSLRPGLPVRNVLVVGTGSIGMRHLRNLVALGAQVQVFRYRVDGDALPDGVRQVDDIAAAMAGPCDAVVVANRTDLHLAVAQQAADAGKALFIEKPLAATLERVNLLQRTVVSQGLVVETGFMLRCHPNLRWLRTHLTAGGLGAVHHVRAAVGQYLPDWRPGTDHRTSYSARPAWGGGVVFDLIHELDLVAWLCGSVQDVTAMTRHVSALDIGTEAIAQIGLRLEGGILAQVHLDYVRPGYGRAMEIVGERGVLTWDYTAGTVHLLTDDGQQQLVHRVPDGFVRNALFLDHMAHFLARLDTPGLAPVSSLDDAVAALRVAVACHRSAADGRHVRPSDLTPTFQPLQRQL